MKLTRLPIVPCLTTVALGLGCETATPPGDGGGSATAIAPSARSDPSCVGPIASGTPQKIKIGETEWELNGSTLTQTKPADGKELTIGAITDIKEDLEENVKNLKEFLAWFKKEKVDVVVVAGDTGLNQKQLEGSLDVLAALGVPVFNIIGNREGKKEYRAALDAVHARHQHVFDLNRVRRVDTPAVDILSMPGYHNPSYIHAEDGCPYYPADVTKLGELVEASNSPTLLVSHGGPRGKTPEAIDRAEGGENVGDPNLTKAIKDNKIAFGIFGNIHEAGGRGTDIDGTKVLKQDEFHPSVFVNPGPADSVRWVMNDKTESIGMAGLVRIKDGKAAYKIMRIGKESPKSKGKKRRKK